MCLVVYPLSTPAYLEATWLPSLHRVPLGLRVQDWPALPRLERRVLRGLKLLWFPRVLRLDRRVLQAPKLLWFPRILRLDRRVLQALKLLWFPRILRPDRRVLLQLGRPARLVLPDSLLYPSPPRQWQNLLQPFHRLQLLSHPVPRYLLTFQKL